MRRTHPTTVDLGDGGRGHHQGTGAASRSWKMEGNEFSPRTSENECSPDFSLVRPRSDFRTV